MTFSDSNSEFPVDSEEETSEGLAKRCEEFLVKNEETLQQFKSLKQHILQENKCIKDSYEQFWKKYNFVLQKQGLQAKILAEKESNFELESKDLTQSMIFNRNNLPNYDFMSQSIAEYFPKIEKSSNKIIFLPKKNIVFIDKSKLFNSPNHDKHQSNCIRKYHMILNPSEDIPASIIEKNG